MSGIEALLAHQIATRSLAAPEREYRFAPPRRWRFDFAWPNQRLAVECEGRIWTQGRHTRGTGFESDCEKYNTAAATGWRVLRFTRGMIESGAAITALFPLLSKSEAQTGVMR